MSLKLSISKIRNILLAIIAIMAVSSLCMRFIFTGHESDLLQRLSLMLNFNKESNLPTYFSVITLSISAGLLTLITYERFKERKPLRYYWAILAAGLWLMSCDEMVGFHERLRGLSHVVGGTTSSSMNGLSQAR